MIHRGAPLLNEDGEGGYLVEDHLDVWLEGEASLQHSQKFSAERVIGHRSPSEHWIGSYRDGKALNSAFYQLVNDLSAFYRSQLHIDYWPDLVYGSNRLYIRNGHQTFKDEEPKFWPKKTIIFSSNKNYHVLTVKENFVKLLYSIKMMMMNLPISMDIWERLPEVWESWLEAMLVEILNVLSSVYTPLTPTYNTLNV